MAQGKKEKYLDLGVIEVIQCSNSAPKRAETRKFKPSGSCELAAGSSLFHIKMARPSSSLASSTIFAGISVAKLSLPYDWRTPDEP